MYRGEAPIKEEGDLGDEVIFSRDPKIVNYSWTKDATRLLIRIRAELDFEFDDPNQRKMDLWEKISMALKENGFDFPPSICDKKWRNLLVSFRRTVSRGSQGKQGRFPYTWEFYDDLLSYWQKKDPIGIRKLALEGAGGEGFQDDEDNVDDMTFVDGGYQDDNYGEDEFDDNEEVGGDLNKFLSVTLTESEDETGRDREHCLIGRRGDIEIRPHNHVPHVDNLEISAVPYSPQRKTDSPPLHVRKFPIEIKPVVVNQRSNNKFRPTPTITIEEVKPAKRRMPQEELDEIDFQASPKNVGLGMTMNSSHMNISLRDRLENNSMDRQDEYNSGPPALKYHRRDNDEPPPPSWLTLLRTMEESAQRRWEVTEARQIREYKQKRELDLQLLQTMQNLSSVLVKMTEEAT